MRRLAPLLVLLLVSACGGDRQAPSGDPVAALGQRVYRNYCLSCHQADGAGVPGMYPPLAETDWVVGDKGRLIRLVLNGLSGRMEVNGEVYNNVMPPHRHLGDEELAAVLTFVRGHFGNEADPVTTAEVAAVRAGVEQQEPWDPAVLEGRTGIPGGAPAE